ncbi:MAG TPA: EthD family reductase, partial [Gemmatimonadaceae bacterium]
YASPAASRKEARMIKVSVMYPNTPGARFDHAYYRDKHMPLVKARMGENCKHYTVDRGLTGGNPDTSPTYLAMCHIFCTSVEAFQAGFSPHAEEIMADIPNYTDLSPLIQISEVVVG